MKKLLSSTQMKF